MKNVSLWYRYSTDNSSWGGWKLFSTIQYPTAWSWSFTFTNGSGYYQFYTIAKDVDGNAESAPGSADRICGYDAVLPTSSVDALTYMQTSSPITVNVTAADTGYSGLKNVSLWYRTSSDNITWTAYTKKSTLTSAPWTWSVAITPRLYYRFYSNAFDNATNSENYTFGSLTGETGTNNENNYIRGSWFLSPHQNYISVSSISAYIGKDSGNTNISFGVYAYIADNNAGALLGNTPYSIIGGSSSVLKTISFTSPLSLVGETKYFLSCLNTLEARWRYGAETSKGISRIGSTSWRNPLTGESGVNYRYLVIATWTGYDRAIYANIRAWQNVTTPGYNTFRNTPSWLTPSQGWNTFGETSSTWRNLPHYRLDLDGDGIPRTAADAQNLSDHYGESGAPGWITADLVEDGVIDFLDASFYGGHSAYYDGKWTTFGNASSWGIIDQGWNTFGHNASWTNATQGWNTFANYTTYIIIDQGWNTFGSTVAWTNITDGWNTFGNIASWTTIDQGWNTFSNQASYTTIDQGWNTFGNISSFTLIEDGWDTFSNQASWTTIDDGWNTFGNGITWVPIDQGWNRFGNTSSYIVLEQGWNTFGNNNYTIFYAVYPDDNDSVDPAAFQFMVNISDTNGTLMNVSWEYWNGAAWVYFGSNLTLHGNGTYYKLPSPWFDLYGVNYTYRVTLTGNQTVNRTITFHTLPAPPSVSIIEFDAAQFSAFLCVIIFLFFFVIGYITTKQSSGLFMFIGAWHLISFGVLAAGWSLVFIPFIVPASIYAMVLGIWKFMRIRREHQAAQGRIKGR